MCCEGLIYKLPQVNNCCGCCRVETGTKVIAWISLVLSFLYSVATIVGLVVLIMLAINAESPDKAHAAAISAIVFGVVMIIILLIIWPLSILLLVGLYKDDMSKVKLWLRANIGLFIFSVVVNVLATIVLIVATIEDVGVIAVNLISTIIMFLLSLYCIAVVKSHYVNKTEGLQTIRA